MEAVFRKKEIKERANKVIRLGLMWENIQVT